VNGHRTLDRKALGFWPLVATIYFVVSGGAHGLEPVMQSGPGLGLLLIVITPLLWALPAALMTAELGSAIPAEGGYYVWVRRAMGPFWGFLCGWWTWLYSWVDVAIYPVLFASYIGNVAELAGHPIELDDRPWLKWGIGMAMIVPLTILNLRGTRKVGQASLFFGVLLLAPFIALVAVGLPKFLAQPSAAWTPFIPTGTSTGSAVSTGLFVVMWNYLGWDSISTVGEEVEDAPRTLPRALFIGIGLVTLSYLLPVLVGIVAYPEFTKWDDGSWVQIAAAVGGPAMGLAITATGVISAAGLFSATLLSSSRIPFVMAEHRLMPPAMAKVHPKFGTPWTAILVSACFYSVLSFATFERLAIIDVVLYSAALSLELVALLVLRWKEPALVRPYRIPFGWFGVVLVALLPLGVIVFALVNQFLEEGQDALQWSAYGLLSAPIIYFGIHLFRKSARS